MRKLVRSLWNGTEREITLLVIDLVVIVLTSFFSLFVRFDCSFQSIDPSFWRTLVIYTPINVICTFLVFGFFRLYTSVWEYAGIVEFGNILMACVDCSVLQMLGMHFIFKLYIPRSYFILYFIFLAAMTLLVRFAPKLLKPFRETGGPEPEKKINTLLIGAGSAGSIILKEALESKHVNRKIPCIIDDDPAKKGSFLNGVPIIGGREKITSAVTKYKIQEIFIAIPSLKGIEQRKILEICKNTGCKLSIMPGVYQLINQEVNISTFREVQIEDLLGRDPVKVDLKSIMDYVKDRVVLVTGGGGSIGSELCRQIAKYSPRKLVIIDNYENNVYMLQLELQKRYPQLELEVLIATVQDRERIHTIFETCRPDLVYHAAAHKHVPLMEESPCEAIKNNVCGTFNVAEAAARSHVKRRVMISTDKAVRPTNIMGASKRICELIVQAFDTHSETEYVAVRFGNVLGSNGSVIPLFRKQIQEGGPVTVTDSRIIRYFMTIPEAVSLVLQAGAYAKGGEIFILDMGEPVKIMDLAENMIKLSGHKPYEDIDIKVVGLRPGEKLYEELLIDDDNKEKTLNNRIFIGHPSMLDAKVLFKEIERLRQAAYQGDSRIRDMVKELVPEYTIQQ